MAVGLACLAFFWPIQPSYAASDAFATFKDAGSIGSGSPIITLSVPIGRYAIFSKINLDQDTANKVVTVNCTLKAGADFDRDVIRLAGSGAGNLDNGAIPLQIVHVFPRGSLSTTIVLSCTFTAAQSGLMSFRFAKITAIRIDGLFCNKPSPAVCP
jgi:hypothetical protein